MIHVPGNESKDVLMMIEAVSLVVVGWPASSSWPQNLCIEFYYCKNCAQWLGSTQQARHTRPTHSISAPSGGGGEGAFIKKKSPTPELSSIIVVAS